MSRRELLSLLEAARGSGDVAPRLVVADWLEEHGDESDRARAEYLRLHCVRPEQVTVPSVGRIMTLGMRHEAEWIGPLSGLSQAHPDQDRFTGLLRARVTAGQLLADAPVFRSEAWAWVGTLRVAADAASADRLAASPLLGHAGVLELEGDGVIPLLASPHLRGVRELDLSRAKLTDDGLRERFGERVVL